jgi:hypothetical protein
VKICVGSMKDFDRMRLMFKYQNYSAVKNCPSNLVTLCYVGIVLFYCLTCKF